MQGDGELITFLIDHGADINATSDYGWTALFMAAQKDHTDVIKILLDNGIDASVKDKRGQTAQEMAHSNGHTKSATFIAEYLKK